MRSPLTETQQRIYGFIKEYIQGKGYPPTIREIQNNYGYKSHNSVVSHIKKLRNKGYITSPTGPMTARTIQLVNQVIKVHTVDSGQLSIALGKLKERGYKIGATDAVELLSMLDIRIE
jgi:repressor LexA